MDFIINNLPIVICVLVGVALLVVELFMPGFGVPGIAGLAFLLGAIVLTWIEHGALVGLGVAIVTIALAGLAATVSLKSAATGRMARSSLILKDDSKGNKAADDLSALVGKTGVALTVLRPAGMAAFDEDERVSVVSEGEFIAKGARVVVESVEGARVVVRPV